MKDRLSVMLSRAKHLAACKKYQCFAKQGDPSGASPLRMTLTTLALCLLTLPAHAIEIQDVPTPSGVPLWLVENHQLPVITVKFAFRGAGYATDTPDTQGRAALLSRMLTEGAGEYDGPAFQKALEEKAIGISYSAGLDHFTGTVQMLRDEREDASRFVALVHAKPRIEQASLARVVREFQMALQQAEQQPDERASRLWWEQAFAGHPYANPLLGTAETLPRMTQGDVRAQLASLSRDRLIVTMVGDVSPQEAADWVENAFAALPHTSTLPAISAASMAKGATEHASLPASPQTAISFGLPGLPRSDPDYYAAYLLNHILGGGTFTSRLVQEIREERGLAYTVATNLIPMAQSAVWLGYAGVSNANVPQTIQLIRSTLKAVHDNGVTAQELADAKTHVIGALPLQMDSTAGLAGFMLSMQLLGLPRDYITQRDTLFGGVTLEQVNRVAKRQLNPDQLLITFAGGGAS
jgi:zinc protease